MPTKTQKKPCPYCGHPLFAETIKGVKLKTCARHGVWFNHEELTAFIKRIRLLTRAGRINQVIRAQQKAYKEGRRHGDGPLFDLVD